jgi:hypothetical protein
MQSSMRSSEPGRWRGSRRGAWWPGARTWSCPRPGATCRRAPRPSTGPRTARPALGRRSPSSASCTSSGRAGRAGPCRRRPCGTGRHYHERGGAGGASRSLRVSFRTSLLPDLLLFGSGRRSPPPAAQHPRHEPCGARPDAGAGCSRLRDVGATAARAPRWCVTPRPAAGHPRSPRRHQRCRRESGRRARSRASVPGARIVGRAR